MRRKYNAGNVIITLVMIIAAHNRGSDDGFEEEMKFSVSLFFLERSINAIKIIYVNHFFCLQFVILFQFVYLHIFYQYIM